jgi:chromosome segregation ATPase
MSDTQQIDYTKPVQPQTDQRLESLRANHPSLATRVANGELELATALAIADQRDREPKSGYRRLQNRHRNLISELKALKAELAERDEREADLQASIDRLLEQHARLMQSIKTPSWFDGANSILNQIATSPDLRSTQVFAGALASLQQKLAAIVSRLP